MDDIGTGPFGAARIELWIQAQLVNARAPEYIADELIKAWESRELFVDAKGTVTEFCLFNGFIPTLIRIIKLDLRSGSPLPWGLLLTLFKPDTKIDLSRELADALLAGASRDNQLHSVAASALQNHDKDSRWENILQTELKERFSEAKNKREKIFKELLIFKSEGMIEEIKSAIGQILAFFPEDVEALSLQKSLGDREFEVRLEKLRQQYEKESIFKPEETLRASPDFREALKKMNRNLDHDQSYYLSIGLFEMQFFDLALETLRTSKKTWTTREKLWEIEILLNTHNYAEALSTSQILLNENRTESEVVKACLYFSAKSYIGLQDQEQALAIIKGLVSHDPHYRDCSILLKEWEQEAR